ncbi:hypothetical protein EBB07_04260 [Paenibacillaceae bacterium]|nr:hypothetical protein EBB07_04260 [Paenibacillaceae bacterium]
MKTIVNKFVFHWTHTKQHSRRRSDMAKKIGVFAREQQAIEAVEALQNEGFGMDEFRVVAKDNDHSRRIEAETDAHLDEVLELAETREQQDGTMLERPFIVGGFGMGGVGFNQAGAIAPAGTPAGAGFFGGLFGDAVFNEDDAGIGSALRALGLNDDEAGQCRSAIEDGNFLVIAETEEQTSESGISRLDKAEAAFRRTGAEQIIN